MNFAEYREFTPTTALYPETGTGSKLALSYVGLGLSSEVAELCITFQTMEREAIIKELGDVCWYFSQLLNELNLSTPNRQSMYGFGRYFDYLALTLNLNSNAGLVAGKIKKWLRGDKGVLSIDDSILVSIYNNIVAYCHTVDTNLDEVLQVNYEKLTGRKERGVIKGDGDNR